MIRSTMTALAACAMALSVTLPAAPAEAQYRHGRHGPDRVYRDHYDRAQYRNYRMRQKCRDGDGGTIVGAIAGGLLGRSIDTRGDRTVGTILGAAGGALAGRAIDRSDRPGYCR